MRPKTRKLFLDTQHDVVYLKIVSDWDLWLPYLRHFHWIWIHTSGNMSAIKAIEKTALQRVSENKLCWTLWTTSGRWPKSFWGFHNLENLRKHGNLMTWKPMSVFLETSWKRTFMYIFSTTKLLSRFPVSRFPETWTRKPAKMSENPETKWSSSWCTDDS